MEKIKYTGTSGLKPNIHIQTPKKLLYAVTILLNYFYC